MISTEISLKDVQNALKKLKPNTSPGPDGLSPELWSYFANSLAPIIVRLITAALEANTFPRSVYKAIIRLIEKKKDAEKTGDRSV